MMPRRINWWYVLYGEIVLVILAAVGHPLWDWLWNEGVLP
jgi:hypothetical protein